MFLVELNQILESMYFDTIEQYEVRLKQSFELGACQGYNQMHSVWQQEKHTNKVIKPFVES